MQQFPSLLCMLGEGTCSSGGMHAGDVTLHAAHADLMCRWILSLKELADCQASMQRHTRCGMKHTGVQHPVRLQPYLPCVYHHMCIQCLHVNRLSCQYAIASAATACAWLQTCWNLGAPPAGRIFHFDNAAHPVGGRCCQWQQPWTVMWHARALGAPPQHDASHFSTDAVGMLVLPCSLPPLFILHAAPCRIQHCSAPSAAVAVTGLVGGGRKAFLMDL